MASVYQQIGVTFRSVTQFPVLLLNDVCNCVNVCNQIGWRVVGSYIKSGSLWLFLLMVVSHLGLIGSQAMANIWLCMWTDTGHCMPAAWRGGANHTDIPVPMKLEVYGIIGVIEGLYTAVTEQRHFPGERRGLAGSSLVFTARRSYASAVLGVVILSVRLSVRPSVCLSHACFVTNLKNLRAIFLYRMKGQSF